MMIETEQTTTTENPDVVFANEAKAAVVSIGNVRSDVYGKIAAALYKVVAAAVKDEVQSEWKNKIAELRKDYPGKLKESPDFLNKMAEIEKLRTIEQIKRANADVLAAAENLPGIIAEVSANVDTLLQRPDHTMSHGTKAADFAADLCGVVLDTKRAVSTAVAAATAKYKGENA